MKILSYKNESVGQQLSAFIRVKKSLMMLSEDTT